MNKLNIPQNWSHTSRINIPPVIDNFHLCNKSQNRRTRIAKRTLENYVMQFRDNMQFHGCPCNFTSTSYEELLEPLCDTLM